MPKPVKDPERKGGDGMKTATGRKGESHDKPMKGRDPGAKGGDGMKVAMKGEGKMSKVPPVAGAKKKVR